MIERSIRAAPRGFYIGATQRVLPRWYGDEFITEDNDKPGHMVRWLGESEDMADSVDEVRMHILTINQGKEGGRLEKHLIEMFLPKHPKMCPPRFPHCHNRGAHSKGTGKGDAVWNFIYVVTW